MSQEDEEEKRGRKRDVSEAVRSFESQRRSENRIAG